MPVCKCGFDFTQGHLDGRAIESYAAIPHEEYGKIIESEAAIAAEEDEDRRYRMIAEGATRIGTVKVCPLCGVLLFSRPHSSEFEWFRPETEPPTSRR